MSSAPSNPSALRSVRGTIIEAEVKVSVSPAYPLPLASALYAIQTEEGEAEPGIWLCAYYGANRSVFDYLPQKGAFFDERTAGIAFHNREFVPREEYRPERWEEFRKSMIMTFKPE